MPGDHRTMSEEPYVRVLAAKLKACLEKSRAAEAESVAINRAS